MYQLCINCDKTLVGLHYGPIFHRRIWSPCSQAKPNTPHSRTFLPKFRVRFFGSTFFPIKTGDKKRNVCERKNSWLCLISVVLKYFSKPDLIPLVHRSNNYGVSFFFGFMVVHEFCPNSVCSNSICPNSVCTNSICPNSVCTVAFCYLLIFPNFGVKSF
jgi:hypothetical protein